MNRWKLIVNLVEIIILLAVVSQAYFACGGDFRSLLSVSYVAPKVGVEFGKPSVLFTKEGLIVKINATNDCDFPITVEAINGVILAGKAEIGTASLDSPVTLDPGSTGCLTFRVSLRPSAIKPEDMSSLVFSGNSKLNVLGALVEVPIKYNFAVPLPQPKVEVLSISPRVVSRDKITAAITIKISNLPSGVSVKTLAVSVIDPQSGRAISRSEAESKNGLFTVELTIPLSIASTGRVPILIEITLKAWGTEFTLPYRSNLVVKP